MCFSTPLRFRIAWSSTPTGCRRPLQRHHRPTQRWTEIKACVRIRERERGREEEQKTYEGRERERKWRCYRVAKSVRLLVTVGVIHTAAVTVAVINSTSIEILIFNLREREREREREIKNIRT